MDAWKSPLISKQTAVIGNYMTLYELVIIAMLILDLEAFYYVNLMAACTIKSFVCNGGIYSSLFESIVYMNQESIV